MLQRKFLVFTQTKPKAGMVPGRPMTGKPAGIRPLKGAKLSIETMSEKQVAALHKDPSVQAIVDIMPLQLIQPIKKKKARAKAKVEEGDSWGIAAVKADTSKFTGAGVVVAVLDTGIDAAHIAFDKKKLVQKDFTGEGIKDLNGHGTHCAGTIFGKDVNGRRIGIARNIEKALIGKVIGSKGADSKKVVDAIRWAIGEGAHIISMSLGIDYPGYVDDLIEKYDLPPAMAANIALGGYRKNVLMFEGLYQSLLAESEDEFDGHPFALIAAAGNESQRDLRADYDIWASPPAVSRGFISVGALGRKNKGWEVAPFSNTGVTLSGPGVEIVSASLDGDVIDESGTSMAAPHVAGVAALWAEKLLQRGQFNLETLRSSLIANAVDTSLPRKMVAAFGAGMVQAPLV